MVSGKIFEFRYIFEFVGKTGNVHHAPLRMPGVDGDVASAGQILPRGIVVYIRIIPCVILFPAIPVWEEGAGPNSTPTARKWLRHRRFRAR